MGLPRLLFFVESPFSARDAERFGIDVLAESFEVTVVDATAAVSPSFWRAYRGLQVDDPRVATVTRGTELGWAFALCSPGEFLPAALRSLGRRMMPLPAPDLYVAGSGAASRAWPARRTRTIHAHSMDVDAYRAAAS
ncbi:MAG: hypothetical protein EBU70_15775, partial [Actinobacteria bacterium]|nr:hypothetical protein [Actinomycetota bacterium]